MRYKSHQYYFLAMVIPGLILLFIFSIAPMAGIGIAFQDFAPAKGLFGSKWVGFKHFERLFIRAEVRNALSNTLVIASWKIVLNIFFPVAFALLLNEVRSVAYKRVIQTIVYLPHFLSWVILGILFSNIFSYNGLFNQALSLFGIERQMHMIRNESFRAIIIGTDVWKEFGYGAIIYLAAISGIDPNVYEAAEIDGANRWQKAVSITLPCIVSTIVLMATLALGRVLNAGFDQIFVMYSPLVYETGDIIDTYVYRAGLLQAQFSFSTAVGLFKSVVSFVLIILSYVLANKFVGYTIF